MARKNRVTVTSETKKGKREFKEQTEKQALTVKDNEKAASIASQLKGGTSDIHQYLKNTASKIDEILDQKIDSQKAEMGKKAETGRKKEEETGEMSGQSKADAELQQRGSSEIDDSKTQSELQKGAAESSKDAQFLDKEKSEKETDRTGAEETTKQQKSQVKSKKINVS